MPADTAVFVSVFNKEVEGVGHFKYLGVPLFSFIIWSFRLLV